MSHVYTIFVHLHVLIRLLDAFLLAKDVAVIELVWQLTDEWNDAWERYKTGNFWTIELEEMDTTANLLLRKLTKLCRELKEKNWEIVENTRCDPVVIQFRTRGKYVPIRAFFTRRKVVFASHPLAGCQFIGSRKLETSRTAYKLHSHDG